MSLRLDHSHSAISNLVDNLLYPDDKDYVTGQMRLATSVWMIYGTPIEKLQLNHFNYSTLI